MLAAASLALACLGCADASPTLAASSTSPPSILATVRCAVDLHAGGSVTCTNPAPSMGAAGGPSLALLGQNQIKMRSANGVSDTVAQTFSMEATVQNLLSYAIGTPDGQVVTGLKVFFETGPTATVYYMLGDTGTVKVRNPDGVQNFTAAQQPYHFYDTILQPQEVTRPKRWEFHVPRTVARFGFTVRVFTSTPRDREIPDLVPDTVPRAIYNPGNVVPDQDGSTVVRDVVVLKFVRGTPLEERRSAIEVIDGRVIGGRRIGGQDGEYYVQIAASDSSVSSLNQALRVLRRLPQVQYATAETVEGFTPDYRLPNDPGPAGETWQLDPDSADGYNWGSEVIQLPFAWGCETGSAGAALAIVDDQFQVTGELQRNVTTTFGIDSAGPSAWGHGTAVASLAAARGDNGAGLTGVAWNADLRLYSVEVNRAGAVVGRDTAGAPRTPLSNILDQIDRAARDGARVINLSYGRSYGGVTPGSVPQHATNLASNAERLRTLVAQLDADGFRPLFVLSAGNDSADARWNLFPTLKDHFADRVLVVGAADRVGPNQYVLHRTSNRGTLVDVLAPGDSVLTMRSDGAFIAMGETSSAAPHVSGLATLLFSFDPRLSPENVKRFIVQGAERGNRSVPGHTMRLINAYESLKLAAQRPGAPLCGNRLFFENGFLRAQRDGQNEPLIPQPATTYGVAPLHGGRKLRLVVPGRVITYVRDDSGGWTESPAVERFYGQGVSGTLYSTTARSHGGDSTAVISFGPGGEYIASVRTSDGVLHRLNSVRRLNSFVADTICVAERVHPQWGTTCLSRQPIHASALSYDYSVSYSPPGTELFFSLIPFTDTREILEWYPCNTRIFPGTTLVGVVVEGYDRCRDVRFYHGGGTPEVFAVRIRDGDLRQMPLLGGGSGAYLKGISEDGREAALYESSGSTIARYGWTVQEVEDPDGTKRKIAQWQQIEYSPGVTCTLRYRDVLTGAVRFTGPCSNSQTEQFTPFGASRAPLTR